METLAEYNDRVQPGRRLGTALGRSVPVASKIVSDPVTHIDPENRSVVLLRDLGTLTPLRELGRGRP